VERRLTKPPLFFAALTGRRSASARPGRANPTATLSAMTSLWYNGRSSPTGKAPKLMGPILMRISFSTK